MFFGRYERKELLEQYLKTQWGPTLAEPYLKSENFYQEILQEARPYMRGAVALDVGCALGRLVFEYEKLGARRSVGIDTSRRFIQFCSERMAGESVEFIRGDITQATFEENSFQFISCINVIDRVKNPQQLIDRLYELLSSGGVLLLIDPYDWELSKTPKRFRTDDMKKLLDGRWKIVRERHDIAYITPVGGGDRSYRCHMLILKK